MTVWVITINKLDGTSETGVATTKELAKKALISAAKALELSEFQLTSFISDVEEDYAADLPYMGTAILFAQKFTVMETEEDALYE